MGLKGIIFTVAIQTLCILKKHWDVLDEAKLVGENLCQGHSD